MKPTFITNSQVEWLKWIGIFAMVLDHIAIVFSEKNAHLEILRIFGRFAFIAFGFVLAVNLTRDNLRLKNYWLHMFIAAVISIYPFKWLGADTSSFNVLFQFVAVIGIYAVFCNLHIDRPLSIKNIVILFFMVALSALSDYGIKGLLYCFCAYAFILFEKSKFKYALVIALVGSALLLNINFLFAYWGSSLFPWIIVSILSSVFFLISPQGIRSISLPLKRSSKWIFYGFYPVHILILVAIKQMFFS